MKNTGTLQLTTPTDREVVLTRVFDAPRHLVFEAFCKPDLLQRWFGPLGWSLVVCELDLRVGGGFRFILQGPGRWAGAFACPCWPRFQIESSLKELFARL